MLVVGTMSEEVIIQDFADFVQGLGMNPRVAEKLVKVLAAAIDLSSQPCDAASLPRQFGFDEFPDMKLLVLYMLFYFHAVSV